VSHFVRGILLAAALGIVAPVWAQAPMMSPPAPSATQSPPPPPPGAAATSESSAEAHRSNLGVHRTTRRYRAGSSSDHLANELNAQELGRISSGAYVPQTYPPGGYGYPHYGYPPVGYAYPYYGYPYWSPAVGVSVGWGWGWR
jgi:hypothetical protein